MNRRNFSKLTILGAMTALTKGANLAAHPFSSDQNAKSTTVYKPTLNSLRSHTTPEWFQDVKFGMFIDYGLYSVAGYAPKLESGAMYPDWYLYNMYHSPEVVKYHKATWGNDFQRDDFIPLFKAEKFDPEEIAQIAADAGMRYVVPFCKHTLDAAQAQLHSLEAQVNEQQVQLHYYQVVAPRAGIVGDVPVRVGDRVLTTTTLTTVDRPGSLEAYIYVPIEKSAQLKMNLPVQIVDGSGNSLASSRVTFISPQVDTTTQSVLVKATIPNSNESLRTAQFIRARVVWGSQEKPVVPVVAVSRIGGQYFAFVAEPDQKGGYVVHQKPLQIGQIVGNDYVVLEGVKPGDKVVVSGTQFLIDGAPVVPQESSS